MKTLLWAASGLLLLALLVGCGGDSTGTKPDHIPPPPSADSAQGTTTLGAPVPLNNAPKRGR